MFTRLSSENFKCLGRFDRALAPLTLLTGFNAAGKSSTVQTLALLRQTAIENEWAQALQLNGPSVVLGTMSDVIDRNYGGNGFSIGLQSQEWVAKWETFAVDRKRDLVAHLESVKVTSGSNSWQWSKDAKQALLRRLIPESVFREDSRMSRLIQFQLASMCHIGAERIGPREVYVASAPLQYPDVGSQGEKTPLCLQQFGDDAANPGLVLEGVAPQIRLSVMAWMGMLFPGFGYEIRQVDGANLVIMGIRTSPNGDYFRPANVGFGITHVLPIITACLATRPGSTLLVENPESHLHPSGQSMIGGFLARAASAGTQVIVETHSDHVLNGVRRAIRDRHIEPQNVGIYFFHGETGKGGEPATQIDAVTIDDTGKLGGWPPGFFDQLETDLDHIHSV